MRKLILALALSFLFTFSASAQTYVNLSAFEQNKKLTDYFKAQGFKFGLNMNDAIRFYDLDRKYGNQYSINSKLVNKEGWPVREGFFKAQFTAGELSGIQKCIFVSSQPIPNAWDFFSKKYGIQYNPTCILHQGRYLTIEFLDKYSPPWTISLRITDDTRNALRQKQINDSRRKALDRFKKKF